MSDSTTIFEIYQQCKNGNCDIMNEHISFKAIFNKSGKYQETQMQTDCTDIDGIVKKTYNDFLKRYPHYKYENDFPRTEFRCELSDIYSEFFHAFLDVVQSSDMISGQTQLCSLIKKNMIKQIRNKYLYSDFTLNGNERLDTDDDGEISLCDRVAYNQWFSNLHMQEKGSFLHDTKELHHIISSVSDISSLFPTDATAQTKLIKLLESSEAFCFKNDDWKLKKISDISALISRSGGDLSEERITQSLNQIYNTLIKCAIGYVPCSRKDYAKTKSNTCNMLSEKTEQEIYKYYKCNSYTDQKNIKCLSLLMLQVNAVIEILIQHGFSPDKEKIIDICLFSYDKPDYWHFAESRNNKYRIYHYSKKEEPYSYNLKRRKTIELDELPKCYIRTAARLRRDLQQAGKNQTITVDAKVSRSSLERSLDEARQQIHTEPIEIPVTADSAALQNAGQAQRDIINSGSGLRNVIQNYVNWNRVLDLVVQAMKKAVSTSSELAKAQTELQIVTGKSNSEMQSLMSGYNALAQDLSVTTTDITSAADEWLRTGKSISDTEKLITDSTILAKIGQLDTAETTKYLTSMMKGFKVETDDVIGIVDRLNAVDMAAAVTSGGLAEAMSKCANSAEIANISMDSLVGYIAAVKEVTQDSDSVVGNAFKSMFSRMGNVKLGKFIDENGEDISGEINNVEKLLSHFGISLRTSATEFRDFEDVIYDVGMAWDKFSSVEKNTIASTFGGTYQREKVTALFENFDRALELTEVSANSAGTAIKKYAVYQDGLEASVNRLTSAFESLAYNTVSQDFLKGLANGAAGIVEFVDKTKLIQTSLTALTFTGAIKGLLLLGTRLVAVKANLNDVTTAMGLAVRSEQLNAAENEMLAQSFSRLTTAQQNLVLSNKKLSTEMTGEKGD